MDNKNEYFKDIKDFNKRVDTDYCKNGEEYFNDLHNFLYTTEENKPGLFNKIITEFNNSIGSEVENNIITYYINYYTKLPKLLKEEVENIKQFKDLIY